MTRNTELYILAQTSESVHQALLYLKRCNENEINTIIDICQSRKARALCESEGCPESGMSSHCIRCGEVF